MITLPIWLFILCIILGYPLIIIILTIISYTVRMCFKIAIECFKIAIEYLKSIWNVL